MCVWGGGVLVADLDDKEEREGEEEDDGESRDDQQHNGAAASRHASLRHPLYLVLLQ